jgi:CRISPR-associated protein Cas2
LRRVAKICKNYGQRVQYSVFECIVDPAQWAVFKQKLMDQIEPETDSLRFYFLGANWRKRMEHVGAKKSFDQEGPLIV